MADVGGVAGVHGEGVVVSLEGSLPLHAGALSSASNPVGGSKIVSVDVDTTPAGNRISRELKLSVRKG